MQATNRSINYRYDFLKYRYYGLALSIFLLASGVVMYFVKGGFHYHIDFTGGIELRLSFENSLDIGALRSAVIEAGWDDAVIQELGTNKTSFLVRIKDTSDDNLKEKVQSTIDAATPGNLMTIDNIEWIGAEVGKDTKLNAFKGVFFALIILLLYIAIRSQFRFAVGAVLALLHDVLMVLVFLLITGEQISVHVMAAVLAVLGYSLNDTIVIFSRIRSNFKTMPGVSGYDIVNYSINETMKRTILTSFSTLLALCSILLLGGETLRALSLVMAVGVVVGTYSSVFIASAGMLAVREKLPSGAQTNAQEQA